MKGKWIWISVIAVLVLVIGGALGVQLWLQRPGVHVFMGDLYVNTGGMGYTFEDKTGECIGSSMVTVDGFANDKDHVFDGDLNVVAFPVIESGDISGDAYVTRAGDFYYIEYGPLCTHLETTDTGRQYPVTHACDYRYQYVVYPEDPSFLAITVYDSVKMEWHTVILAENEEQAKERYQWFLANEPSLYD